MFPVLEDAAKRSVNQFIYKAIKANYLSIEQVAELKNVACEEIEEIINTFSQEEEGLEK